MNTVPERNSVTSVMEKRKATLLAGFTVVIMLYLVSIYFDVSIESFDIARFNFGPSPNNSKIIPHEKSTIVLFWTTMFGNKNFYFGTGNVIPLCPESYECLGTHDRTYAKVEDFDAILFHHSQFSSLDLPTTRNPRQRYVYVNLESPVNRPLNPFLEDFFNLTMTYRLDSDIPWPYGYVAESKSGQLTSPFRTTTWRLFHENTTGLTGLKLDADGPKSHRTGNKSKMVAWFVSNCHTGSKRENYVDELEKYIEVHKYGNCSVDYKCPRNRDCFEEVVEPKYFFYLSFENSLCQDYVTEKLYNALRYNVVPVVYGGANYSLFAPPHSYIDALSFEGPRELADYLKKLSQDPARYETYFNWKTSYRLLGSTKNVACELCRQLRENNQTKVYNPLSAWYKTDKCPMQEKLQDLMYASGAMRSRN